MKSWKFEIDRPWRKYEAVVPKTPRIVVTKHGRKLVQVCSTQYLAILWNRGVREKLRRQLGRLPVARWGSLGSNYLGGTHPERLHFQRRIAELADKDAALAFASGWSANYAVSEAISRICDVVVVDKRCHNSIYQGLRAGNIPVVKTDLVKENVNQTVRALGRKRIGIISPSVEGITGEVIVPNLEHGLRSRVFLVYDECHTFGIHGKFGTDCLLSDPPDVRILGLSKAIGSMGAAVCSGREFIDYLGQVSSPWIFSTSVPPNLWSIDLTLVEQMLRMNDERQRVLERGMEFRERIRRNGVQTTGGMHISGIRIDSSLKPSLFESRIAERGFYAKVSQYPSRPKDDPVARIAFNPYHTNRDLTSLVESLNALQR